MIFGVIWLKWVLDLQLIVFVVNHMVDMVLLVQTLVDMEVLAVLVEVAQMVLEVLAAANHHYLELVNIQASLDPVDQVEIMVDQTANNADVKLKVLAHLAPMAQLVKLAQMVSMVFLDYLAKMDKIQKMFLKNLHQEPSIALQVLPAHLDHQAVLEFVVCEALRVPPVSPEMMASLVPQENKVHLVLPVLMANPVKLAKKEMMLNDQLQEKVHVELPAHKEMKDQPEIKDQLAPQANLVKQDLPVLLDSKDPLALMVNKDLKVVLVPLVKMLNTVPALIATEEVVDLMVDVVAQEELEAMVEVVVLETMETMEVAAVMLVLLTNVFVFKRMTSNIYDFNVCC